MFGFFRNRSQEATAIRLYDAVLTAARRPAFYLSYQVPDTVEGRFDLMTLHLFLLVNRLNQGSEPARAAAQLACDRFFTEMDRAFREMGVGDLTVPKKMKKIAGLYAGCSRAYSDALASAGNDELTAALLRNIYEGREERLDEAVRLADYVRRSDAALGSVPPEALATGAILFAAPEPAEKEAS